MSPNWYTSLKSALDQSLELRVQHEKHVKEKPLVWEMQHLIWDRYRLHNCGPTSLFQYSCPLKKVKFTVTELGRYQNHTIISTIILGFPYWGDETWVWGGMMYFQNDKNGVLEVLEIKTFFAVQP